MKKSGMKKSGAYIIPFVKIYIVFQYTIYTMEQYRIDMSSILFQSLLKIYSYIYIKNDIY